MNKETIPWVEKYRPDVFDDIILDNNNKELFKNILERNQFPNLLLHGPPGIGKTTTIINLIDKFKKQNNEESKTLVIHLNASDERGIDIIRNNIYNFVISDNLFSKGTKFVILDEVDYMTKIAQQALKCLIQEYNKDIKYCLICNYISKVDHSLKNEFISIRFNQLPKNDIHSFIKKITADENINIDDNTICKIQSMYHSDIRSMVNFIQLHQSHDMLEANIITSNIWEELYIKLKDCNIIDIQEYIHSISIQYNIDKKTIIKQYYNYIIRKYPDKITINFLNQIEIVLHNDFSNINNTVNYMKQISTL